MTTISVYLRMNIVAKQGKKKNLWLRGGIDFAASPYRRCPLSDANLSGPRPHVLMPCMPSKIQKKKATSLVLCPYLQFGLGHSLYTWSGSGSGSSSGSWSGWWNYWLTYCFFVVFYLLLLSFHLLSSIVTEIRSLHIHPLCMKLTRFQFLRLSMSWNPWHHAPHVVRTFFFFCLF